MTIYESEIDLRPYIITIARNWWKVLIFVLVAVAIVLWIALSQPYEYEATASILLTRSRASLALAREFPTLNEPIDSASRMNAFLSIAKSDALAYHALSLLGDEVPPEERDLDEFKEKVTISNTGDLILVKARSLNPVLSKKIADTWAEQAVLFINQAYSGDQLPSQIQTQLESARVDYEASQAALESFLKSSQLNVLQKRLLESQTLYDSLSNSRAWEIAFYTQRVQDLDQLISKGEALRQQLDRTEASQAAEVGDALAVITARATAFNITLSPVTLPQIPSEEEKGASAPVIINNASRDQQGLSINLNAGELSELTGVAANYRNDLDTLIQLARVEKSKAEQRLQELSNEVINRSGDDAIQRVAAEIQVLNAQLENELARQKELTSNRDLAWKAYQVLAEKDTELRNATETNNQVNLATHAVPPEKPLSRGILMKSIIGVLAGSFIGILFVLMTHWWQSSAVQSRAESRSPAVDPG